MVLLLDFSLLQIQMVEAWVILFIKLMNTLCKLLLTVSLVVFSASVSVPPLTITAEIMQQLLTVVDSYFYTNTSVPLFPVSNRKLYRLAFHDCVGGCDGSINVANAANNGLNTTVVLLNSAYTSNNTSRSPNKTFINTYLSRADFFTLVELRAIGYGIDRAGQGFATFNNATPAFKYGRSDNALGATSDNNEGTFPDGGASWNDNMVAIISGLKGVISQAQLVTLLGLHGAGANNITNSGYNGPWGPTSTDSEKVHNRFYTNLLGVGFPNAILNQAQVVSTFGTKVQWNGAGPTTNARVMLHADMGIYYNYTPDAVTKTTSFVYYPQGDNATLTAGNLSNSAPLAATRAQQAFNYAKNNILFLNDIIEAMKKMSTVPNTATDLPLVDYYPQIVCINNIQKCYGDVFFTNCGLASSTVAC